MDREDVRLTLAGTPKPKYVHLVRDGAELRRRVQTGTGKPRTSGKTYPSAHRAGTAMRAELIRRMRDGFVVLRDPDVRAEAILEARTPGVCAPHAFDLSPDGRVLAYATRIDGGGIEIHLLDVVTGERRVAGTDPAHGLVTGLLFHGDDVVYSTEDATRRLDVRTGAVRTIASAGHVDGFGVLSARPAIDAARERLLVFDAGPVVRVDDKAGEPLLTLPPDEKAGFFRAAALSPSGRLLALAYRDTNLVDVWDVDSGERETRMTFPFPFEGRSPRQGTGLDRIGFHADDRHLIATGGFDEGPFVASIGTGTLVWHRREAGWTGRWTRCRGWAFTPDGSLFAFAEPGRSSSDPVTVWLLDGTTFTPVPDRPRISVHARPGRLAFSADGSRVASGVHDGLIVVHAVG